MLDDLIGYEIQKKKLVENTEAFVQGRKANNALLSVTAGQVSQLLSRLLSMNIMTRVLE